VRIVRVHIQLSRNLLRGEIQTHEIQTQDPGAQRLMMAFKDGAAQIVKLIPTRLALIALPMGLMRVKAALGDLDGRAYRAADAAGPA